MSWMPDLGRFGAHSVTRWLAALIKPVVPIPAPPRPICPGDRTSLSVDGLARLRLTAETSDRWSSPPQPDREPPRFQTQGLRAGSAARQG